MGPNPTRKVYKSSEGRVQNMSKSNKKKSKQLGLSFGAACYKLQKNILFDLIKKLNLDICFRCNQKIDDIDSLSIDHKIAWMDSNNPIKLFYSLDNITFSHLKCNCSLANKNYLTKEFKATLGQKGSLNYGAKLTDLEVVEIKKKLLVNTKVKALAQEYKVTVSCIKNIKYGYGWKHISI